MYHLSRAPTCNDGPVIAPCDSGIFILWDTQSNTSMKNATSVKSSGTGNNLSTTKITFKSNREYFFC